MSDTPTKIVLLGGGFGGVCTAIELEKQLSRHSNVEPTLVSRQNFFSLTRAAPAFRRSEAAR
jgi:NADH dehydrogenase FAD-containing subunit